MNTELTEILGCPALAIRPSFVHGIMPGFLANLRGHVQLSPAQRNGASGFFLPVGKAGAPLSADTISSSLQDFIQGKVYTTQEPKYDTHPWYGCIGDDDLFINIINVSGPITRNGGACSRGSKQHRDQVYFALSKPNCIGHIWLIDTPGGMSVARYDYEQATEAIRKAGFANIGIVDGNAYSMGQLLSSLMDQCFYTEEHNGFGCIGTMAAFCTRANGSKNQYTEETYRELYDPESFDKNAMVRELVNEEDDTKIIEILARHGKEFRDLVKARRPKVTDEMLHGNEYDAKDVEGILNDGKLSLAQAVEQMTTNYFRTHPQAAQEA